jgi:hypothetical protein
MAIDHLFYDNFEKLLKKNKNLNYVVIWNKPPGNNSFSLNPNDSGMSVYDLAQSAVVGNLVRYGNNGFFIPYLAEKWTASEDELHWEFFLRPNLKCSDGELITAESFVANLKKSLKRYGKDSGLMTFNHLKGWQNFIYNKTDNLLGIRAVDNKIIFDFADRIENVLDTFTTKRFGYWCSANFKNDEFDKSVKFVSSGAYEVIENPSGNTFKVKKGKHWYNNDDTQIETINFETKNLEDDFTSSDFTIVNLGTFLPKNINLKDMLVVKSPPKYLTYFVLSPYIRNGIFNSNINRNILKKRISNMSSIEFLNLYDLKKSSFLYENAPSKLNQNKIESEVLDYKDQIVNIKIPLTLSADGHAALHELFYKILPEVPRENIQFNIFNFDIPSLIKIMAENTYFDIKISTTDSGEYMTNLGSSGIEIMFCTKLGARLPDKSGKICKLSREYGRLKKNVDQNYINQINQYLADDAVVIPFFHSSTIFLYSNDFDPKSIPAGIASEYPIYEKFKFK